MLINNYNMLIGYNINSNINITPFSLKNGTPKY